MCICSHSFTRAQSTFPVYNCLTFSLGLFPVTMYESKSWALKKQQRKHIDSFKLWCWRRLLKILWTAKKTNLCMIKQINPAFSLKPQMTRLK